MKSFMQPKLDKFRLSKEAGRRGKHGQSKGSKHVNQATAQNQQRIFSNKQKLEAKIIKDLEAIKKNDFTDTSLADLTKHLSLENTVNNTFVLDKDIIDQKTSMMEQQITQNLLNHKSADSTKTEITSRRDPKVNNKSTILTTETNSNYGMVLANVYQM